MSVYNAFFFNILFVKFLNFIKSDFKLRRFLIEPYFTYNVLQTALSQLKHIFLYKIYFCCVVFD